MHRFFDQKKAKNRYGKRYREDCPLPEDAFLNSLFILNKN